MTGIDDENTGARTRKLREPHESVPWRLLQDERMSYRAQGVLTYLLSLPDNWRTSAGKLAAKRKEGRGAVETALGELEEIGYLARRRVQYKDGRWAWLWLYGDDPAFVRQELAMTLREMAGELHPGYVARIAGDESEPGVSA